MNKRDVIGTRGDVWNKVADPFAALAVLFPGPRALHYGTGIALKQFDFAARIKFLSVAFDQRWLVIKRVALARRAGHKKLHNAFRASAMMQAAIPFGARRRRFAEEILFTEQLSERDTAEATAKTPKKFAAP